MKFQLRITNLDWNTKTDLQVLKVTIQVLLIHYLFIVFT